MQELMKKKTNLRIKQSQTYYLVFQSDPKYLISRHLSL
jgi:hypothetical protein